MTFRHCKKTVVLGCLLEETASGRYFISTKLDKKGQVSPYKIKTGSSVFVRAVFILIRQ